MILPSTIQVLCSRARPDRIVRPYIESADGKLYGHPVIFGRNFKRALLALQGDRGAQLIINKNNHALIGVAVNDVGISRDIDTPQQLSDYFSKPLQQ